VRASNQAFAIPLNTIERILHQRPQQITPLGGHDTIRYDGRPLTLVRLSDVLELPRLAAPKAPTLGGPASASRSLSWRPPNGAWPLPWTS